MTTTLIATERVFYSGRNVEKDELFDAVDQDVMLLTWRHTLKAATATAPALASISPATSVHGTAAITMTATGTNFTSQSKIALDGVPQTTTFVSATSITCTATPPVAAGTVAVTVKTGTTYTTTARTWTIT